MLGAGIAKLWISRSTMATRTSYRSARGLGDVLHALVHWLGRCHRSVSPGQRGPYKGAVAMGAPDLVLGHDAVVFQPVLEGLHDGRPLGRRRQDGFQKGHPEKAASRC